MNKPAFMSRKLKVTKVGNSAGVILPKDLLAKLNVNIGDEITLSLEDGAIVLNPRDDEFDEEMTLAREIMIRRRDALRELAK